MVVNPPDDHVVFQDVFGLEFVEGIRGQIFGLITIVPESVFMRDHHVQTGLVGAFEHVESHHDGGGDALDGGIGVAEFEGVPVRLFVPGHADVLLNQLDYFTSRHQTALQ